jgi:hypothetical protein
VDTAQGLSEDGGDGEDADFGMVLAQGEGVGDDEFFYGGVGEAFVGGA